MSGEAYCTYNKMSLRSHLKTRHAMIEEKPVNQFSLVLINWIIPFNEYVTNTYG